MLFSFSEGNIVKQLLTLYENYKLALLEIEDYEKIKAIVNKLKSSLKPL